MYVFKIVSNSISYMVDKIIEDELSRVEQLSLSTAVATFTVMRIATNKISQTKYIVRFILAQFLIVLYNPSFRFYVI